jgi:hypothetical protein
MKHIWKLFFITLAALLLLSLSNAFAKKHKSNVSGESDAHTTCVYNYMSCRDKCDYFQDKSQTEPCKARCDRAYGCRPTKVERPVDNTPNEPN